MKMIININMSGFKKARGKAFKALNATGTKRLECSVPGSLAQFQRRQNVRTKVPIFSILINLLLSVPSFAQSSPLAISGVVTIEPSGIAARNAVVTIVELKKSTLTDENGSFQFKSIPTGKYQVIAHFDRVPDVVKTVDLVNGSQTIDFQLS